MPPLNFFLKRFGLFTLVFVGLSFLCMNQSIRDAHNSYYCAVAKPIFNIINPHVYTDFSPTAPENPNGWNISFMIYDESKHTKGVSRPAYRKANKPTAMLFQNVHELILVPTLFLLALFFASPIDWKKKLIRFPISLLLFYIFMTLYLSYRFELTVNGNNLAFDSLWHIIIWFFGLGGTTDPIFIIALFIWGVLVIPEIIKTLPKYVENKIKA